jgi:hypothetical protein
VDNHWHGGAAPNQFWQDALIPIEPGESLFEYNDPGNYPGAEGSTAVIQYVDPTNHYRTVFSAVGFEGIQQRYVLACDPPRVISRYQLSQLYHNIGDFLRTGSVLGYLRYTQTMEPVEGARVELLDDWGPSPTYQEEIGSAISRADGSWRIDGVPPTIYIIRITDQNQTVYYHMDRDAICGGAAEQLYTIDLSKPSPGTISGRVTELDGRTGIPGAQVCFTSTGGSQFCTTTTIDGTYSVQVAPGSYTGCASKEDYATACRSNITVNVGEARTGINFVLGIPGDIAGRVTSAADGAEIARAFVEVLSAGTRVGSAYTNDDGDYEITGLAGAVYDVRCTAAGYVTQTKSGIQVLPNETTTVNFQLQVVQPDETYRWDPGIYLISLPRDYRAYDPAEVLNYTPEMTAVSLASWYTQQGRYELYAWYPCDDFYPGRGYWLMASEAAVVYDTIVPADSPVDDQDRFSLRLYTGWNMIGCPFPDEGGVAWADVYVKERLSDADPGLTVAQASTLIRRTLWGWDPETRSYVQSTSLQPWNGYWVKAMKDVWLLITKPTEPGPQPPPPP